VGHIVPAMDNADRQRFGRTPSLKLSGGVTRQAGFIFKSALIAAAAALSVLLWVGWPWLNPEQQQLSLAALESRYATPDSQFTELDGVRLHYMDQGSGPAVVLLHASFMNLRSWDSLAESLTANFRVIRLDFLASGLTGPEPNDKYSFDRNLELVEQLTQQLGVSEFALVGTSSGGIVAFNFAARYPERVTRLVLVNSAGMPRNAATNPNRARGNPVMAWLKKRHKTRGMVRDELDGNFIEPHEPPSWLVDMNYDMGRREGLKREGGLIMANFKTGDPEVILSQVKAPTLIIWGLENQTVFHLEADVFRNWLTAAPTLVKKYADVGHYLYLESPAKFESDIIDFLDGRLDKKISIWQRAPYKFPGSGA
jgi:pimeloyl-ACP methyl ester carboxylesterase